MLGDHDDPPFRVDVQVRRHGDEAVDGCLNSCARMDDRSSGPVQSPNAPAQPCRSGRYGHHVLCTPSQKQRLTAVVQRFEQHERWHVVLVQPALDLEQGWLKPVALNDGRAGEFLAKSLPDVGDPHKMVVYVELDHGFARCCGQPR